MKQANVKRTWARVAACCVVALASLGARADDQAERIKALEQRLDSSAKLIDQLSRRISDLERSAGTASPPVAATAASAAASTPATALATASPPSPSLTSLQEQVDQINDGLNHRGFDLGLPLHGFADVQAATSTGQDPLRLRGFNGGTLDLYLTPQLGDRVRSLVEIAFEYDPDGRGSAADMERLQLGYSVNDSLTLWMGRFHTPFGLWNTYFHHGANLQTSIYRPQFIEFEDRGGIIPAHSVGIWASGKTAAGPGRLTYDAYLSNGPSIRDRSLDFNPFTDDTANKMVGFNLGYQPSGALRGLSVGVHGFASNSSSFNPSDVPITTTRLRMAGAYAGYDNEDWEAFAEYYGFFDVNNSDGSRHRSNVGFAHLGRTFGSWTPYARYERASIDAQDNYFNAQLTGRSYTRGVLGVRYALDARSSLKFELSSTTEPALNQRDEFGGIVFAPAVSYRRAAVQYSIAF